MSAVVVLGVINLVADMAILGVLILRRVDAPSAAPVPIAPPLERARPIAFTDTRFDPTPASVHALSSGPRFHVEAIGVDGVDDPSVGYRGDDEQEAKRIYNRLHESSDVGTFTFYDRRHPGHRGRFSRGIA